MKRKILLLSSLLVLFVLLVFIANVVIENKTKPLIYDNTTDIPKTKVGLVLGTAKYLSGGTVNLYFKYRIEAAFELYKAGKISYIVVSGDNHHKEYNEPQQMKDDLVALGVPEDVIYLDYAGFRTLDSVVRMKEIFGQNEFIIISQPFHNERAIYIARHYGIKAYGYNALDVNIRSGLKTQLREKFARVKVFIDFIIHKQPKFLGDPIEIGGVIE